MSGFLCAFEIPIPGSPVSASSPIQTGKVQLEHLLVISASNTDLRVVIFFIFIWAKDIREKDFLKAEGNLGDDLAQLAHFMMRNLKFREPE